MATPTLESVLTDALLLTESDRERLLLGIRMSLGPTDMEDSEYDRLWAEEIRQRLEEVDSGAVVPIPWAQARVELTQPPD